MRKLMWFTIGFGAASLAGVYLYLQNWMLAVAAICLLSAVGACFLIRWKQKFRIAAVLFLGCTVGALWCWGYDSFYLDGARQLDGETCEVSFEISDYSWETDYGSAAQGRMEWNTKQYNVRIYLEDAQTLSPGDRLDGTFRFRLTAYGGSGEPTYHRGNGIFLIAYQSGEAVYTEAEKLSLRDYPAYIRQHLLETIEASFPEDTQAFARALLLGDTTQLDYETDTNLKISGIRHVAAVSGLHVTILFTLLFALVGRKRVPTAVIGIPVLILFAAIVGFSSSITRACVMQILMILAMLVNREYDQLTALSVSALIMMVGNPNVVTSVSFQLSVGCMVGIFLLSPRIKEWLMDKKRMGRFRAKTIPGRLARWFSSSVSMSIGATAVTAPLSAGYFGTVSLIGIVTNLLTLWLITFIFYGIMLVCILGVFWPIGGSGLAMLISWPIRYVLWIAGVLADFPAAAVYTCSTYVVIWLVFCYLLLAGYCLGREKKPVQLICCSVIGLCLALGLSWAEPLMDSCRLTVLDVGQGQCILFQSEGRTYLVDCGGDDADSAADTAAQQLLSQGINRLDGVIVTHLDRDHSGGISNLLSRIPADYVLMPNMTDETGTLEKLYAAADGNLVFVEEDMKVAFGETSITIFAPDSYGSDNESSLCVLFQTEKCDILVTGDRTAGGERRLLHKMELPKLEVLIVGHHGSRDSTCQELLDAAQPETAIISVGADNRYGHPTAEVLERLTECGCEIYRTDLNGTIVYKG